MFTDKEINLLKQYINIAGIARKHNISPRSNYIYKLMRKGISSKNTKGYQILNELERELKNIKKNGLV